MNIIICDDQYEQIEELKKYVEKFACISKITDYCDGRKLLENLNNGETADLIFMDIKLEDQKTGLDYAQEIYMISPKTKIVYVTGYVDQYVQQLFFYKANVIGIITKPIDYSLVDIYIERMCADVENETKNYLALIDRTSRQAAPKKIPYSDILYLESEGHYIMIITNKEQYKIYGRMIDMEQSFPNSFIRCHKGFIINLDHLEKIGANNITMKNGKKIPVGRVYNEMFKKKYFIHIECRM